MEHIAGIGAEESLIALETHRVRLWRVRRIEEFVDTEELLREPTAAEPPYWMHLWPGALTLARIVSKSTAVRCGSRVIEIGCGLALPALVAAARGASVVATDEKMAPLEFARQSALSNGVSMGAVRMRWGELCLRRQFDVFLGADAGYDPTSADDLSRACHHLLREGGVAWFADSVNTYQAALACSLRERGFRVNESLVREEEEGRVVWVRLLEVRCGA